MRLITLLPGTFGTETRIELKTTVLSESKAPTYEALSYTWGSTVSPVDVYVEAVGGDSRLAVTRYLEAALQYLRYDDDGERLLWIDAVCTLLTSKTFLSGASKSLGWQI